MVNPIVGETGLVGMLMCGKWGNHHATGAARESHPPDGRLH